MYRYFILIWNPQDAQPAAAARSLNERLLSPGSRWQCALEARGLAAFHAGLGEGSSTTVRFDQGPGAVFGRIFNRDIQDPVRAARVEFDSGESLRIVQSGGGRLLERYWGRYVALFQDPVTGESSVLRDPTGGLPALTTRWQGVNLVFSDLEDCLALGLTHFSVNWEFIRRYLSYSGLQSRQTALNEVSEIQFGERIRFAGKEAHRSFEWDPITLAQTDPIQDPDIATAELRRTTRGCVHTWAACYTDILHNLSGGLDSSIVLSCLMDAPSRPNITCLNHFGTGPDEDERKYARAMAARAGTELVEHPLDIHEARLQDIFRLRHSARPWFYFYELEHGRFEFELAAERHCQGLFSGSGGDGVFFQTHADLAVTDYLFDHGAGSRLVRVAADAARISRKSVWPLLFKAFRSRLLPRPWHPLKATGNPSRTLISQDILDAAALDESLIHPWFAGRELSRVPPGTLWHILCVAAAPAYYSSFESGPHPERTLPLMSQPLIELCLRTPTYVLIKHGMDRATARRAFAADLPAEIIKRRNKGRIDQHVRNVLDDNLSFVRDILLDGRLVREGLLNRRNLELYLTRERSPADFQYAEILHEHLCTEVWLSRWLDGRETLTEAPGLQDPLPHQALRT